jgi:hypothetical protein
VTTKAAHLRYAVAFALRKVGVFGKRWRLTEDERFGIADTVIHELRRYRAWPDLDDEVPTPVGHCPRPPPDPPA